MRTRALAPKPRSTWAALGVATAVALLVAGAWATARTIRGTPANEVLNGTRKADLMTGGAGDDLIRGGRGNDSLFGQGGNDRIYGGPGRDRLWGGPGDDVLRGDRGNDRLSGGPGSDRILGGPGADVLIGVVGEDAFNTGADGKQSGGAGDDVIYARDGDQDTINCGPGYDVAYVDAVEDGVYDCEKVIEP